MWVKILHEYKISVSLDLPNGAGDYKVCFWLSIFFKVYAINEMYLYIQEIKHTLQWNVWGNGKINKLNTSPEGTC